MTRRSAVLVAWLPFLVDAGLVTLALRLSYWLRFESGLFAAPKGIPPLHVHVPAFGFQLLVLLLSLHAFGLYRARSGRSLGRELVLVLEAVTAAAVVGMAATFLYRDVSFSRLLFFQAWALSAFLVGAGRAGVRFAIESAQRRGWGGSRVALVGWGRTAWRLYDAVEGRPSLGYHLVGWVGRPEDPDRAPGAQYLGGIEDLRRICRDANLDGVLVALPQDAHERLTDLVARVDGQGIEVRFIPDLVGLMSRSARVSEIDGIPLIGLREFPLRPLDRVAKRVLDVVISAIGLVVLSPLMAVVAVLIRVDSPGPVIYRQRRVGRDGRTFVMYKFRSMRHGAEDRTGPVWAERKDARATRVGQHLRRLTLDELPQLVNVLVGDMTLVGPRPEREPFVRQFEGAVPRYLDRHRVKSGMTGWAQVHGLRGNTSIEERTEYDIFYVENWSVVLDLRILWLTVLHLLSGGGPKRSGGTKPLPTDVRFDIVDAEEVGALEREDQPSRRGGLC